jgi:co-chaperonin GroES (HSP10)
MNKQQIQEKLSSLKSRTELLNLSNHKALGDYIIVVEAQIQEPGITTRAAQFEDRPEIGLIVAVGEDVDSMEVGNVVFFGKYSHIQVTHDDVSYLIMRKEDVYCVAE